MASGRNHVYKLRAPVVLLCWGVLVACVNINMNAGAMAEKALWKPDISRHFNITGGKPGHTSLPVNVTSPKLPEHPKANASAIPEKPKLPQDGKPKPINAPAKTNYTTVVEGYVYCMACPSAGGKWIKSLSGALVSVTCKDGPAEKAVQSYGYGKSNNVGYYQVTLIHHHPLVFGTKLCKAKLLASSDHTCNVVTNTGNGKLGANLMLEHEISGEKFFKVAPFAFMPFSCAKQGVGPQ